MYSTRGLLVEIRRDDFFSLHSIKELGITILLWGEGSWAPRRTRAGHTHDITHSERDQGGESEGPKHADKK